MEGYRSELAGARLRLPPVPSYAEFVRLEAESRADPKIRDLLASLAGELAHGSGHLEPVGTIQPQLERTIVPITMLKRLRAHSADWQLPMKSLLSSRSPVERW